MKSSKQHNIKLSGFHLVCLACLPAGLRGNYVETMSKNVIPWIREYGFSLKQKH